ncbi:hypothetical protein GWK47_002438 [Chionoecetes opilio]|uniref:RNase H type-1 domain-containing protein n=1 Tax=Chionoecetes opilio TaxID=41210 RepID=A0A8J4XNX5_CHIOP|nr:hypothetical protein GWK47_002438 [Chionoecetes opilio]
MAMAQVAERDRRVYFTDGSVDPDSGRTGAAFVTTGGTELSWRTSNQLAPHSRLSWWPSSTPRTCPAPREANCGNTHDSWTGLQALQQPHPKDNVRSSPPSWAAYRALSRREGVGRLNWIPSHVGVRGNEAGDAAAKRNRQRPQRQPCTCLPAYSSSRRRRDGPQHTALTRHTESWRPGRGRRPRYAAATDYHQLDATQQQPRADGAYCSVCVWATAPERSCRRTSRGKCATTARCTPRRPGALPPSCPATAPLRPGPDPAAQPAGGGGC